MSQARPEVIEQIRRYGFNEPLPGPSSSLWDAKFRECYVGYYPRGGGVQVEGWVVAGMRQVNEHTTRSASCFEAELKHWACDRLGQSSTRGWKILVLAVVQFSDVHYRCAHMRSDSLP